MEARAMSNTLTVYNNLQYNPIEIGDFCIVEVYEDEISLANALGYFIQPLDGVEDIKETIATRARQYVGNMGKLAVLAGREFDSYNRRIVYAVFYIGETAPTYPDEPEQHDLGAPGNPFDFYQNLEIDNDSALTSARITLTLDRLDLPVEFYINNDHYKIDVSEQIPTDEKILVVDKTGVSYNSNPINTYEFLSVPKLKYGKNQIRVNRLMIRNIKVEYARRF